MKIISFMTLVFIVSITGAVFASDAKVTLKWIDEDGVPVPNVRVAAGYEGDKTEILTTDKNGVCTVKGKTYCGEIAYSAKPDGFYYSQGRYKFREVVKDGKWQPWNPVVTTVVRRIVNPIPMYAKRVDTHIPGSNEWFGYDLMVGDWVKPSGKGISSDLVFYVSGYWTTYRDYDSVLRLKCDPEGNGIVAVRYATVNGTPTGSELFMPRYAPSNGYISLSQWHRSRQMVDKGKSQDKNVDDQEEGKGYLFRARCIINEYESLTNAFYGKIPADIRFGAPCAEGCFLKFTYYLNPTPNDRNMEFDPKRNLMKNLKSTEQVNMP